jgi:hypothetical protein
MSNAAQKSEVVASEHAPSTAVTPMEMLATAIDKGMPVETIDKLMTLAERYQANHARMSFNAAVADAKAETPVIVRNRSGHNNKRYADFAAIASVVDPILGRHGLGYRFRTVQDDKTIRTTCVLFHKDGYSEENTLAGPADASGSKNAIQAIGSTLTYLQRYSLVQALGLAAGDDDDGKTATSGGSITADQLKTLESKFAQVGGVSPATLAYFEVASLAELPAKDFDRVLTAVNKKIGDLA